MLKQCSHQIASCFVTSSLWNGLIMNFQKCIWVDVSWLTSKSAELKMRPFYPMEKVNFLITTVWVLSWLWLCWRIWTTVAWFLGEQPRVAGYCSSLKVVKMLAFSGSRSNLVSLSFESKYLFITGISIFASCSFGYFCFLWLLLFFCSYLLWSYLLILWQQLVVFFFVFFLIICCTFPYI